MLVLLSTHLLVAPRPSTSTVFLDSSIGDPFVGFLSPIRLLDHGSQSSPPQPKFLDSGKARTTSVDLAVSFDFCSS